MVKKVIFALFVGVILTSGLVFAAQPEKTVSGDVKRDANLARAIRVDETYGVRSGEVHRFDALRNIWLSGKAAKQVQIDTVLHFTGDEAPAGSWNDRITGTPWDTVDFTIGWAETLWHVDDTVHAVEGDTVVPCSGDSAWWWGDPDFLGGGYDDDRWEALISPSIVLTADNDSVFMIYDHWLRCEESHDWPYIDGWDGYNVRIDLASDDTTFFEIYPYKVADDSSYYKTGAGPQGTKNSKEWANLRCWERHGEPAMGGYAQDTSTHCTTKIYDLRPYAGDTIKIEFVYASDWEYATPEDSTLFGLILDDILIVDDMDSLALATLPDPLGGDTLFYDGAESYPHPAWDYQSKQPTGNLWWLASGGHTGIYKAYCGDQMTGEFLADMDNAIVSPKIANADLSADMAELELDWFLKADVTPHEDNCFAYNMYKLDDGQWTQISVLTHPTHMAYVYSLSGVTNTEWWSVDQWSTWMNDLHPLVTDTTIAPYWDTLQVCIGFTSDAGIDPTGTIGLQVDDATLAGRIGAPYDLGVSALKIPGPNANDIRQYIDTVAVYNYGFNTASTGSYTISMEIQDSTGTAVFGPSVVGAAGPQIDPFDWALVPLDTSVAKFTFTEEGVYDFYVWTNWPADTTTWNDTLRTVYTAKAYYYPGTYNYPAGQGQLRYHDQGFYNFPYINIRRMDSLEVAAVHYTPESRFYPFDCRLALPEMLEVGGSYELKVYGPGPSDDEPGAEWATIPFTTPGGPGGDTLRYQRIELDTVDALQHLSSDFWLGVHFPTGTDTEYVMGAEVAENDAPLRNWGHSYIYEDTSETKQWAWTKYDWDWMFTCVISVRTVDPEAMPSLSGPPKNASGNLYLDWPDVSQAQDYLIYRSTHIDSPFPFLDSTAVSNYTDVGVVGSTTTNYYYLFHTRHQDGYIYDKTSAAVGEFDKSLSNVK